MNAEPITTPASTAPAEEVTLNAAFQGVIAAWRPLVCFSAIGLLVLAVSVAAIGFVRPTHERYVETFRVSFSGVENGRYPNGVRFAPVDVVANSVLQEVYNRLQLQQRLPYDAFARSFAVAESNPALARLERDYADRLAARNLTPVERKSLEDEYADRVSALRNGEFAVVAAWNPKTVRMPADQLPQICHDILDTWSAQSNARGVFQFDVNMYSPNIFPSLDDDSDYLLQTERLREATERVIRNIRELDRIPSARQLRVGAHRISLGELQSSLQGTLKYHFSLMDAAVMRFGLYRNRSSSESYLAEQLLRSETRRKFLQEDVALIRELLLTYTSGRQVRESGSTSVRTGAGQEGQSFLEQILNLSNRTQDTVFRQSLQRKTVELEDQLANVDTERRLYQRRLELLRSTLPEEKGRDEARVVLAKQVKSVAEELRQALHDLQAVHEQVSQNSLRPEAVYNIIGRSGPSTESVFPLTLMALLALAVWTLQIGAGVLFLAFRSARRLRSVASET